MPARSADGIVDFPMEKLSDEIKWGHSSSPDFFRLKVL